MKILFVVLLGCLLSGCGTSGHPVPEGAFTSCTESGGTPVYYSSSSYTKFDCEELGK